MADEEKRLEITELDFHKIKRNFRSFMKSQSEFSDYELEASGLDVIQDLLAYNTHYNAFLVNMQTMENSLITANRRASVSRESYPLGYLPRSSRGSEAVIDIRVEIPNAVIDNEFSGNTSNVRFERNNRFQTTIDGRKFLFVNPEEQFLEFQERLDDTSVFESKNVLIRQGHPRIFRYTVDLEDTFQSFTIPHENVDINTLQVHTLKPGETNTRRFRRNTELDIDEITETTRVFFLRENAESKYEVMFGDGQYGYELVDGEEVTLEYNTTDGEESNGARSFSVSSDLFISGVEVEEATVTITDSTRSSGGAFRESLQSIKLNAPQTFQAQDRAVSPRDFKAIVKNNFNQVESVTTWGGEQNDPPRYGTVMLSVKPFGSLYITENEKDQIRNKLQEKMFNVVRVGFLEPVYLFVGLSIRVLYNSQNTLKQSGDIRRETSDAIREYSSNILEMFDSQMFFSDLIDRINNVDDSIVSNNVSVQMLKKWTPEFGVPVDYNFEFQNPIYYPNRRFVGSIESTEFDLPGNRNCRIVQSSERNERLKIIRRSGGTTIDVVSNAGVVNYDSGSVSLSPLSIEGIRGTQIQLRATPREMDIATRQNYLMIIEENDVSINVIDVSRSDQLGREIVQPDPEKLRERLGRNED